MSRPAIEAGFLPLHSVRCTCLDHSRTGVPMIEMRRILIGLALLTLLPASAMAQKVSYDYDRRANFSQLRTYAFKDVTPTDTTTAETTTYDTPFITDRIRAAVASQ